MTLVLAASLALGACATTTQIGGAPGLKVLDSAELPPPDRRDMVSESRPYFVGPYDKLTVDVYGIEELSKREVQVDSAGQISFPLAGVISVSGKTPGEIEGMLARALRANVRSPQVSVNVKEMVSQLLTVEGQVQKPGLYPVLGKLSLLQALALSGGTTEFSKLNQVVVFRNVGGQRYAALYDIKAIRLGRYGDPEVFAKDIVVVGDNTARRFFKDLLQVAPLLTAPLIVAVQ